MKFTVTVKKDKKLLYKLGQNEVGVVAFLTEDKVKQIAHEVVNEHTLTSDEVRKIVSESVRETLIQIGVASDDPLEMQKDMQHFRVWRLSYENIRTKGMITIFGVLLTGAAAAFWVGFKEIIHK